MLDLIFQSNDMAADRYELEMNLRDEYGTYDVGDSRGLDSPLFINSQLLVITPPKKDLHVCATSAVLSTIGTYQISLVWTITFNLPIWPAKSVRGCTLSVTNGHTFDGMCRRLLAPDGVFWAYIQKARIVFERPTQK